MAINSPAATIYEHANYQGRALNLPRVGDYDVSSLNQFKFNDITSSLRVSGRFTVQFFEHASFTGKSLVVSNVGEFPKLNTSVLPGFNDIVSSIRVYATQVGSLSNDSLMGSAFNDALFGRSGDDYINGGSGNDMLIGDSGKDTLIGGAGDDNLDGWGGSLGELDVLTGGQGRDTFALGDSWDRTYYMGANNAVITDFDWRSDKIELGGRASEFRLAYGSWGGSASMDTALFKGGDCIALIQDTTNVSFARDFLFV